MSGRLPQVSSRAMQDINSLPDADSDPTIPQADPLARGRQSAQDRKWPVAIIASGLLHAAAAAAFFIAPAGMLDSTDAIQAQGSDRSGAEVAGSVLDNQPSGAVDVTLVPDPRPPEPETAKPVAPAQAAQSAADQPTSQAAQEAVRQPPAAPKILEADSPRPDDQTVAASSDTAAPANPAPSAEAPPAEAAQPPIPSAKPSPATGSPRPIAALGAITDGDEADFAKIASKGGKQAATGNAIESRYSGEIQKKLARANRRVSKSIQAKARNNARVVFVVAADGSVSDLQLAESSGSDDLDQFALKLVRQQAPFPPIPPETGRSSWVFRARVGPF
ncbi:energy transducer TonB [Mesorhizobium argentiipisi]|uniref:Energy transducer TonB n=1 Tax=Mesorhizobium argentiipisi TaxID=3015175 RepID=A0ABU8K792_9HYPH